jgi:protein-tyrosine phosphatase
MPITISSDSILSAVNEVTLPKYHLFELGSLRNTRVMAWAHNQTMPRHPDRALRLQGATNFRDLGGYPGHGGRPLRWRRLFRSDHLGNLTPADCSTLAGFGLERSFDFRGRSESASRPYKLSGVRQYHLSIEPTVVQRMDELRLAGRTLTAAAVAELMKELYRGLVNEQAPRFAELFEHLLQSDAPSVFHCTAGKDRTGIAAALVLLALGVRRELVVQDYLLTNELYRHPASAADHRGTPPEALAVLWQVQQGFLDAALQVIDTEHGGVQRYLGQRLGLGKTALDTLASRYLDR